jgi:hypothetical protein
MSKYKPDMIVSDAAGIEPHTMKHTLICRFQPDDLADMNGAEIGVDVGVMGMNVAYLPDANRGAAVTNGDAIWFEATSFDNAVRHAIWYTLPLEDE